MAQAAQERLAKGRIDVVVDLLVEEAAQAIEVVADESWVAWAARLVPNIARRVKEDAMRKAREEEEERVQKEAEAAAKREKEEAEREAQEKEERALRRQRRLDEKLDMFLAEKITESELERDSEPDEEIEHATGEEEVEEAAGTEGSAMEVDDAGEDEVMAIDDVKQTGGRKRAPSSPPKPSKKRARAATSTPVVATSTIPCERCTRQKIVCVPSGGGARCVNCKAKHLGCSLVPAKEAAAGASGVPRTKPIGGSRPKRQVKTKKAPTAKAGVASIALGECACYFNLLIADLNLRSREERSHQAYHGRKRCR